MFACMRMDEFEQPFPPIMMVVVMWEVQMVMFLTFLFHLRQSRTLLRYRVFGGGRHRYAPAEDYFLLAVCWRNGT